MTTSGLRRIGAVITFIVGRVIAEPVREGRLRDNGWSPGLRAVVTIGLILFVVLTAMTFTAGTARRLFGLTLGTDGGTFPLALLPVVVVATVCTLTLLATAALRMRWWWKVAAVFVLAGTLMWVPVISADLPSIALVLVFLLVYVGLLIGRRNRPFRVWEFVLLLLLLGHATFWVIHLSGGTEMTTAVDVQLNAFITFYLPLFWLATPVALLAGAAMAELTIATITWSVSGIWQGVTGRRDAAGDRVPVPVAVRVVIWVVLLVGSGVLLTREVFSLADADLLWQTVRGVGLFGLLVVLVLPVLWRSERGNLIRPDADDVIDGWPQASLPIGPLIALPFLYQLVAHLFRAVGLGGVHDVLMGIGGPHRVTILLTLGCLVLYGLAWRQANRGRDVPAVVLAAVAANVGASTVGSVFSLEATVTAVRLGGYLAAVVTLVVLVVRRRLTTERGVALAGVLALTALFDFREFIYEPVTFLIGMAGVSAGLVVGLIWRMLTDQGWTRGDTPGFPRSSRVMIALANLMFGGMAVAMVALFGGYSAFDLEQFERIGDHLIGNGLWAGVTLSALVLAWRGQVIRADGTVDPALAADADAEAVAQPRWLS
ncbi:hypothetical protein [Microlunatus sp. Y2014]|uniref:hypothetical protein n=1 Tax=Microlunatus sp. Y2014 TaxID=3418488 RepID=UPI003DA74B0F